MENNKLCKEEYSNDAICKLCHESEKFASNWKNIIVMFEFSFDGLYVMDNKGVTVMVNKAYEKLSGIKSEEVVGTHLKDLEKKGLINKSCGLIALKTKKLTSIEQILSRTGKKALVTSNPILDENGNVELVVSNVRDITELYDLRTRLATKEKQNEKYHMEIETIKKQLLDNNDLITNNNKILEILNHINKISKVDTTILILGETGVGKEEFAKYIHRNSNRSNKAFIKINCGAIPETLLESELFGYENGAFTGAHKGGKMGLFEVADKGTIFLDEIGELPLSMQVKLLRVLQEKKFERLGSTKTIEIDVRLIAATNRNLEEMMNKKLFRSDLYYRLSVIPITIPPLRERKDDIPLLIDYFLNDLNKKYRVNKVFSESAYENMQRYNWPGNIRELKNIVERVVLMSNEDVITRHDLPLIQNLKEDLDGIVDDQSQIDLKAKLEQIEFNYMNMAYERFNNVRSAANFLNMNVTTFVRKRKKYLLK